MAEIRMETLHFHVDGHLIERRRVALAMLQAGERVSEVILDAAQAYMDDSGAGDCYAFVRSIPTGAEEFTEIATQGGTVVLVYAPWVPAKSVAVGRGGQAVRPGVPVGDRPYMEVAHG